MHKVKFSQIIVNGVGKLVVSKRRALNKSDAIQQGPFLFQIRCEFLARSRGGICDGNVQPSGEEEGDPAGADNTDILNGRTLRHITCPMGLSCVHAWKMNETYVFGDRVREKIGSEKVDLG